MHPLLNTLKNLSETASNVLPCLEKYDYRKEAKAEDDRYIPMDMLPKTLQDIVESLLVYCTPLITRDDNLPQDELLNKKNMQIFIENLNITGDSQLTHQLQFIELEPIHDVACYLDELGLNKQARLIGNVYEFAGKLRSSSRANCFGAVDRNQPPVQIHFTVPPEELTEQERLEAQRYTEFCGIFKVGVPNTAQRRALYDEFKAILACGEKNKPHLVIAAAICLMMNKRSYGKPLAGTYNHIRSTVFTSLGLPADTAKNYVQGSTRPGVTPSLVKHTDQATLLLEKAFGKTR